VATRDRSYFYGGRTHVDPREYIPAYRYSRCKYCAADHLTWRFVTGRGWRLHTLDGDIHQCAAYTKWGTVTRDPATYPPPAVYLDGPIEPLTTRGPEFQFEDVDKRPPA
jgi:hypothetical protein